MGRRHPELHGDVPRFQRTEVDLDLGPHGAARANSHGRDQATDSKGHAAEEPLERRSESRARALP